MTNFEKKLTDLLNEISAENGSDTPDFILAEYLLDCLKAFTKATFKRELLSVINGGISYQNEKIN